VSASGILTPAGGFEWAIAHDAEARETRSDGATIRYRCWNPDDTGKPPLLFVHGYRGHSRWWDFIAPYFLQHYRIAALDLSGMGDSDHRPTYSVAQHSGAIAAVLRDFAGRPASIVGHSYGGARLIRMASDHPELVHHAIVLDSWVRVPDDIIGEFPMLGRPTPYPDYATARSRFRLVPDQSARPELLEHVAHHSLREVADGWRWKFDTGLGPMPPEEDGPQRLRDMKIRMDFVYGANSAVVSAARARCVEDRLAQRRQIEIPDAGHHLMLDQPEATIAVVRALLAASATGGA